MSKFFKFTESFKTVLNIFNYKIEHVDSWYVRQENFISEISDAEKEIAKSSSSLVY